MALVAAVYSVVRIIEAIGLWLRKTWAQWFAVLSGGIYIPLEVYEVVQHVTWPRVTVLTVNFGIVSFLLFVLQRDGKKKQLDS